jgi:hypothetical protein
VSGVGYFLLVAGPGAAKGLGLGIGILGCASALLFRAALVHERRGQAHPRLRVFGRALGGWSLLAGAVAAATVWEIVSAAVFTPDVSRWLTLANGVIVAALACVGLVVHETTSERVVYVLEVVERPERR